jgi:cytochrome c biogenesis factor
MPARWPPLLYLGFAHLCLASAFALAALDPGAVWRRGIRG